MRAFPFSSVREHEAVWEKPTQIWGWKSICTAYNSCPLVICMWIHLVALADPCVSSLSYGGKLPLLFLLPLAVRGCWLVGWLRWLGCALSVSLLSPTRINARTHTYARTHTHSSARLVDWAAQTHHGSGQKRMRGLADTQTHSLPSTAHRAIRESRDGETAERCGVLPLSLVPPQDSAGASQCPLSCCFCYSCWCFLWPASLFSLHPPSPSRH